MMASAISAATRPLPPGNERGYLSFSAVNAYRRCPLSYYFKYVAGLPEHTVSASLVLGAAVHRGIEHHFRELMAGNPPPSLEAMLEQYQAEWQERAGAEIRHSKEETPELLAELAHRLFAKFQASDAARPPGTILAVEERLRGQVIPGLPDLLGVVDLVVETPDELQVFDWKTSRSHWSEEQADDNFEQLVLYASLASDFAPGKPIRTAFGVLVKTKKPSLEHYSRVVTPAQVDRTKRIVERVWKAIEAEHFFPAPSPLNCGGCPFREPCRAWPA